MKEGKVVTKSAEDGVARSRGKHEPTHLDLVHRLLPGFSPKFTSDSFFKGVSELLREAVQGYLRQLADPDETIKEVVRRAGNAATLMANLAGVSLEMLQNTDDIIISTRKGAIKISSEKVACLVQERSDELDAPRGGHGGGWSTGMGTYWDLKRLIPFRKEVWRALQKAVKSSKSPTGWRISVAHLVAFIVEDMLENVVGGPANRSSARK
ncbi:MAG: hypothetical protein HY459_00310 [Parcubacteria group bacterium]|nr:hypothetical protein [Parcubacteria group bacterium]